MSNRNEGSKSTGRSRTVERRKEKMQQQKRQQQTYIALALVAVVVIGAIAFVLSRLTPADGPIPEGAVARYEGLEMTTTADGYPRLGDPEAPVEVVEYSSFGCPHCKDFEQENMDRLVEYVRSGDINVTFVPIASISPVGNAESATRGALCAGEQNAFWTMHDALFSWQETYGAQAFIPNRLVKGAENLGLDLDAFNTCLGSSRPDEVIRAAQDEIENFGSDFGTPRIHVDGTQVEIEWSAINQAIQTRLAFSATQEQPEIEPTTVPDATNEVEPTEEATDEPEAETEATEEPETEETETP